MRACLLVVVDTVLASPALAHAVPPDRARTQTTMADYFDGEQRGGYVLMGLGVAG